MTDRPFIARKGTFLIPTGPQYTSDTEQIKHLHFVCSDVYFYPKKAKDSFLAVNITTIVPDQHHDNTCILNVGDHPFVRHPSYVLYREAAILGADTTASKIQSGEFSVHDPCTDEIFRRIVDGFEVSDEVRGEIQKFYLKYCKQ